MSRRSAYRRVVAEERGVALVMAMLVLTVLAIALGSILYFTSANQRTSHYQKAAQTATTLAEAGVNNGISVLSNPVNSCCLIDPDVLPSSEATAYSTSYQGGTVKWWGTIDQNPDTTIWPGAAVVVTLYGKATVPNPTGPTAAPIVKTMTAKVKVYPPKPDDFDVGVWNTIYSPGSGSGGCDTSIAQGVDLKVKLFVGGNLCVENGAKAEAPVYVNGWVDVKNKQSTIGSNAAPVSSTHVGSWCRVASNRVSDQVNPCRSEPVPGGTPGTNIWVQGAPTDLRADAPDFIDPDTGQLIAPPSICWTAGSCTGDPVGGWYVASSPGPLHPCKTQSGTPPTFESPGSTTMNVSVPGTFNLTPDGVSYSCKTASGELSWDYLTRKLTVAGTVFVDGNLYATSSGSAPITYTGWGHNGTCTVDGDCEAVIFASGTLNIQSEKLCAKVNAAGTDCDWTGWDPNKKILIFATHSQGTQSGVGANQGIVVGPSQTSFQGGLYADYQIVTGQLAITQGPLVSGTKTVITGQQFNGYFPEITILPLSIQGPPGGYTIDPPTDFSYTG